MIILFLPLRFHIYNFNFYEKLYENNAVYDVLERSDVRTLTYQTFDFFKNKNNFEEFDLKSNIEYFSDNEIKHLEDVRLLIKRIFIALYASIFLFIILTLLLLFEKNKFKFLSDLSIISITSSSLIILFMTFLYIAGNNFFFIFEKFHLIFFPQGNWQFPPNSLIITIFPFGFFFDFFKRLIIISVVMSIVLFLAGITGLIIFNKKIKNSGK